MSESSTMPPPLDLSVVVPVYNEEANVAPLHEELRAVLETLTSRYEILFVDDGSSDGSAEALRRLYERDTHVRVVRFRRNFGQTAAFTAGFDHAQGALIVTLDADGQNDPADIPRLVAELEKGAYDIVVGWRVDRRESLLRRLLSGCANAIINRVTGLQLHDRGCSLKLFKADLVGHIRLYGELHRFLPEIVSTVGARVAEIPVNDRRRRSGRSKYGAISRTPRVLLDLITVAFMLGFFTSPMRLFGSIAFLSGLSGLLIDGGLALMKIFHGLTGGPAAFNAYQIGNRPLFFLGFLLILLSVQFLMMGLLGEMIMRTYYEAQNKPPYYVREIWQHES
ncbi:MAG: glycosyltransferase family 2 protein [Anaerolineae bacterium]